MKNLSLILSLVAILFSSSLFAQEVENNLDWDGPDNIFYFSPLAAAASNIWLSYERSSKKNSNSVMILGGFHLQNNFGGDTDVGGRVELQYRLGLVDKAWAKRKFTSSGDEYYKTPKHIMLYLAPYGLFDYNKFYDYVDFIDNGNFINSDYAKVNTTSFGAGVVMGARLTFFKKMTLDAYAGVGGRYTIPPNIDSSIGDSVEIGIGNGITSPNYSGIVPKGNIQLGVAF